MKINLSSTSNLPLTSVVKVALPFGWDDFQTKSVFKDNTEIPLIREYSVGNVTDIYSMRISLNGGENASLEVKEGNPKSHSQLAFSLSPWVAKNPAGSTLRAEVELDNGQVHTLWIGDQIHHIRQSPNCQTFELKSNVSGGWRLTQYLTAYSDLDHVDFQISLNWSDQTNPNYALNVKRITLLCNDEFRVFYQSSMGLQLTSYSAPIDTWKLDLVRNGQVFRDGQGIEVRGVILAAPEYYLTHQSIGAVESRRLANLSAIRSTNSPAGIGAIFAVCDDINNRGNWFNGHLPTTSVIENTLPPTDTQAIKEPSIFGARALGTSKTPRQSGAQKDFGADKGFEATVLGNPLWLQAAIGSMTMGMRWQNIHSPSGSRVTKVTNPGRVTWNLETFDALTNDTLGKTKWAYRHPGNNFEGWDNQHRSMNLETVYAALTGDHLAMDLLKNVMHADMQQARNLDLADREVGRTFQCWSRILRLLHNDPIYPNYLNFINGKINEFLGSWRGRLLEGVHQTVKCSQVILDSRSGIVNPQNGNVEPSWICYQHAQMISGIYSLLISIRLEECPKYNDLYQVLKTLCETYIKYGVVKHGETWYPIIFSRYISGRESGLPVGGDANSLEGTPLDPTAYDADNWQITLDKGNGGWWDWVCPAVSISCGLVSSEDLLNKAKQVLRFVYPDAKFKNVESAEWFPLNPFKFF